MKHLKRLSGLYELHLDVTEVTDVGLEYLNELDNLQWLKLWHTKVTKDGVRKLQRQLPNCSILEF